MKKFVLAVAVTVIACSPALAAKKHHAKRVAVAQPASGSFADLNDNGFRLVRDSMPIYYPSILKMVLYPVGGSPR
jgi:hypothetical protein